MSPGTLDELYPLRKTIIYLDQFAISEMAKSLHQDTREKVDPYWKTLFGKLDRLCQLQVIICPTSNFHNEESRMKTEHFEKIQRVISQLSRGISFKTDSDIRKDQILRYADCWVDPKISPDMIKLDTQAAFKTSPHSWLPSQINYVSLPLIPEWSEGIRRIRSESGREYNDLVVKRWWEEQKGKSAKAFFKQVALEEANDFGRITLKYAKLYYDRVLAARNDPLALYAIMFRPPSPAFVLVNALHDLFFEKGVPEKQLGKQVGEYLLSPLMADIPVNELSGLLHAASARKYCAGQSNPPVERKASIISDVSMIATLSPYCDAMMIDKECFLYLNEPDVKQYLRFSTRFFSFPNRDEFICYLDDIEHRISPAHMAIVKKVYGDDWGQPSFDMFEK